MKAIISLIFAIFIIALFSCDSSQPIEQDNTETSYFPLQVGNEWIYEVDRDTVQLYTKVTGKTTKNDREYFILNYVQYQGPGKVSEEKTMYLRSPDGKKIYQYENDAETLFRDFSEVITDTNYTNKYITSKRDYIDIPIGRFNDVINVRAVGFDRDAGASMDYAKRVGLIRAGWCRGSFHLKYAKVNGKVYQ